MKFSRTGAMPRVAPDPGSRSSPEAGGAIRIFIAVALGLATGSPGLSSAAGQERPLRVESSFGQQPIALRGSESLFRSDLLSPDVALPPQRENATPDTTPLKLAQGLGYAPATGSDAPQQDRPLMVRVGGSAAWDSNVFFLPDSQDPQAFGIPSKSDRLTTAYVGLRLDKLYKQQRFLLDVSETAYRYEKLSFLNFNAFQYRGEWQWHLTPRLSGSLSADRDQSLVNYQDIRLLQRDVQTTENRALSVDWRLFGGWHVLGGLTQYELRFSTPFGPRPSYRESGPEAGFKYVAASGSWAGFNLRSLRGVYVDQALDPVFLLDDGFRRSEAEFVATWLMSSRSTLDGRLARVDHRSNHFDKRSFSGTVGRLGYQWQPVGKLGVNFSASRELNPWIDFFSSYRVDDRLSFGLSWELSARSIVRMSLDRGESHYRNPITVLSVPQREDIFRGAQLAIDWKPLRNASVTASLQRNRRTSNDPTFQFRGSVLTVGASLMF